SFLKKIWRGWSASYRKPSQHRFRMTLRIPAMLAANCAKKRERAAWLTRLPDVVRELAERWSLTLGAPLDENVSASWVAPATRAEGTVAVLKLSMPHMEGEHEIQGLRFWKGNP